MMTSLDHPAYTTRVKMRGYNGRINVMSAITSTDAGRILVRLNPKWTKQDHAHLAQLHDAESVAMNDQWNALVKLAAIATWGRKFEFTDYRISAIVSDDFSEEHKRQLRELAHSHTKHRVLAQAHRAACRNMRSPSCPATEIAIGSGIVGFHKYAPTFA